MRIECKLPRYGTNMEEGTVWQWLKAPGDEFTKGEPLCEIETEKVTATYDAPVAGTMVEHVVAAGDALMVGDVLCRIETR